MIVEPLVQAIRPGLALLPPNMRSRDAEILLLAIGFQESGFLVREQYGDGPAHGFWQFEKNGGVRGVLEHRSSRGWATEVCYSCAIRAEPEAVWRRLTTDDRLGAAFARLLLWTAPKALPQAGWIEESWQYYLDLWRPGKPHPERWTVNYGKAMAVINGRSPE